jgi:N6-L-threonylcarbamoyladenine synthase
LLHLSRSADYLQDYSIADTASSFQQAIVDVLTEKTIQAANRLKVKQILLSGGVAANTALRDQFIKRSPIPVVIPPPSLCTDNAAMIAACGYYIFSTNSSSGYEIDVVPGLSI